MKNTAFNLFALSLCLGSVGASWGQDKPKSTRNDQMYPPAAVAKPFIDYDGAGFIINGKRAVISSGTIHYPRVPRELWADRMLRMKQADFNCVETYAFWNLSEPQEGVWDFGGNNDIGAFLDTARQQGLYAIVRVGPYVCAEWNLGGWPVWLKFKPPMNVRTEDPAYLALNDHWYDKIFSVVAPRQINHGGNVVLVQLENEHPLGWGVVTDQPYFVHLNDTAVKDGLQVPHFMSGLNHGGSPHPGSIDPATRANPWFTTEFWSGWFDAYRTLQEKKLVSIDTAQWTILAHGGGGYNFYMVHGGSNFDTNNDDSVGASYDYGTAIGQTGDLRPMYYRMKRANQLAQSFPAILADGMDALPDYKDYASGPGVQVLGARRSPAGTFIFLQSSSSAPTTATLKTGETLQMTHFGTYPLPLGVALADGLQIASSSLPVLGMAKNGDMTTLVVYGEPGQKGSLTLASDGPVKIGPATAGFVPDVSAATKPRFNLTVPKDGVAECDLVAGSHALRLLAVSKDLSLYTWLLGPAGRQYVVCGPAFVRDLQPQGNQISLTIERPYGQPGPGQAAVYGGRGQSWHLGVPAHLALDNQSAPQLTGWQRSADTQADPNFNDAAWLKSDAPQEMGAGGNNSAFSWYRATVDVPAAGSGKLTFQAKDSAHVFVNGRPATVTGNSASADFAAGQNTVAIFVSHRGRNKVFGYRGSLTDHDNKGLLAAPVLAIGGEAHPLTGWRQSGGPGQNPAAITSWTAASPADASSGLPAFYRARFSAKPPAALGACPILRVNYAGLTRGTMWINGHNIGQYPEKIRIDTLYVPECWLSPTGENTLTVFDEQGADPAQVRLSVETASSRELARVSEPVAPTTPLVVPPEYPQMDLVGMNRGNLAFGRPATASATANGSSPAAATDGDPDTAWNAPPQTLNVWLQTDLGQPVSVKVCEIVWGGPAKNYHYVLEGSADGQAWTKLGDNTTAVPTSPDSPSELSRLNLSGQPFRCLRVTLPDSGKGIGIAEFRAFESAR